MSDLKLRVNTIYPAIQGEGVMAGTPMILVRLQGCGVGCPWCDTKESWEDGPGVEGGAWTAKEIAKSVRLAAKGESWVLLTGGEPTEQDFGGLVVELHKMGYKVALETSGTGIYGQEVPLDHICLSPKSYLDSDPYWYRSANECKWPVGCMEDVVRARKQAVWREGQVNLLQPLHGSSAAIDLCIEQCRIMGWRLSIQIHKMIGLP